jgi:hypothetical protein
MSGCTAEKNANAIADQLAIALHAKNAAMHHEQWQTLIYLCSLYRAFPAMSHGWMPLLADRELGQDGRGLIATQEEIRVAQRGGGGEPATSIVASLRDELGGQVPPPPGVEVKDLQVGPPPLGLPPLVEVVAGGPELGVEVLEPRLRPQRRYGHLHQHDPRRVHVEQVRVVELHCTNRASSQWLMDRLGWQGMKEMSASSE